MTDSSAVSAIVDRVLENNPASIADYKQGREKALQYLMGQVMKESKGKATPQLTRDLILRKLH